MNSALRSRQQGLSLVELMIAITLSLLLILGVTQIFLSSKQTYSTNNGLSRVQENGRFAIEFLTQDIRNTGYKGQCLGEPLNHLSNDQSGMLNVTEALKGWNNVSAKPGHLSGTPLSGTDAILVKFAAGVGDIEADATNTAATAEVGFDINPGIPEGAITLISDSISCDLFQNTAEGTDNSVSRDVGINSNAAWTHDYTAETEVLTVQNATYYIRANAGRQPSLVRERLAAGGTTFNPEELVEGVQDMQILYGTAGANMQVTNYVPAQSVTNWESVVSVQINLLVTSADTNVLSENQVIAFNGADVTIANRRLARVFTTTIGIRNRLP